MKRIIITAALTLTVAAFVPAQGDAVAVIEFVEDIMELQVVDDDGFELNVYIGIALQPGDRIMTGNTSVELQLQPNGTIVNVAPNTNVSLDSLQGRAGAAQNALSVERGRLRMVASRLSGRDARYEVRTPSAVAGVRGTDFGVTVARPEPEAATDDEEDPVDQPAEEAAEEQPEGDAESPDTPRAEQLYVFSGEVSYTSQLTGEEITVTEGELADVYADTFAPREMSPDEISSRRRELAFQELNPAEVPDRTDEAASDGRTDDAEADGEAAPDGGGAGGAAAPPQPDEAQGEREAEPGIGDELFGRAAEFVGLQVGSVTLNENTYAQVLFQPRVSIGPLALELYLPITYQENLFDPNDWYRPEGNDEWSFGTDQDWENEPVEAAQDLARDLTLKIKSIQYGERRDPFFLLAGSVSNFTIGQGLLMRNYANDVDFPAVRSVGFNVGINATRFGIETVVDDIGAPQIFGGRIYFRPAVPVTRAAVGFSAVTDIGPGMDIRTSGTDGEPLETSPLLEAARSADPIFLNVAGDIEIPIVELDILSLITYAEGGGLIPYLREDASLAGDDVSAGLKTDALVDFSSGDLKNFGWATGVRGTILPVDYFLEFRSYDGIFRPGFYGPSYERLRGNYAAETVAYLADTEAQRYQTRTMGVAGQAGFSLFGVVEVAAGYFWPWEIDESGELSGSNNDELNASVDVQEGLIPFGIQTGLSYRRTHFAATVAGWDEFDEASLFDADTTLDGYVSYPFNEFVSLVVSASTTVVRDDEGDIVYDDNGRPEVTPTVSIETRIGF